MQKVWTFRQDDKHLPRSSSRLIELGFDLRPRFLVITYISFQFHTRFVAISTATNIPRGPTTADLVFIIPLEDGSALRADDSFMSESAMKEVHSVLIDIRENEDVRLSMVVNK